jgi:hypothetical protein
MLGKIFFENTNFSETNHNFFENLQKNRACFRMFFGTQTDVFRNVNISSFSRKENFSNYVVFEKFSIKANLAYLSVVFVEMKIHIAKGGWLAFYGIIQIVLMCQSVPEIRGNFLVPRCFYE